MNKEAWRILHSEIAHAAYPRMDGEEVIRKDLLLKRMDELVIEHSTEQAAQGEGNQWMHEPLDASRKLEQMREREARELGRKIAVDACDAAIATMKGNAAPKPDRVAMLSEVKLLIDQAMVNAIKTGCFK